MQRNLRNAALQFREAFDVEVGRAVLSLQVGPVTARDGASEQYADRYEAWVDTSEHPRLVSDIFVVDAVGRGPAAPEVRPGIARLRARRVARGHRPLAAGLRSPTARFQCRPPGRSALRAHRRGVAGHQPAAQPDRSWPPGVHAPRRSRRSSASRSSSSTCATCGTKSCRRWRGATSSTRTATAIAWRWSRPAIPSRVLYRSDPDAPTDPASADASQLFFGPRAGPRLFFGRRRRRRRSRPRRAGRAARRAASRRAAIGPPRDEDVGRWRLHRPARQRVARNRGGQRAPAQPGHQLRHAAAAQRQRRTARRRLAPRAPARRTADGVRGRRHPRVAHARRGDPVGGGEPVARRRRQRRPRQTLRHGDRVGGAAARRDDRERAAVRRARVRAVALATRPRSRQLDDRQRGRRHGDRGRAAPARSPCSATSRPICRT